MKAPSLKYKKICATVFGPHVFLLIYNCMGTEWAKLETQHSLEILKYRVSRSDTKRSEGVKTALFYAALVLPGM